jgi:hypothetical protein
MIKTICFQDQKDNILPASADIFNNLNTPDNNKPGRIFK